jgi:hypothetical protein
MLIVVPSPPAPVSPGASGNRPLEFGPYRLVELLSSSAVANVYRATDRRHDDRVVAVKIFAPALAADPCFRKRFREDAAALSALREPHVVPVHTYGELAGVLFLEMRLLDGHSLAALRRAGRLPASGAAELTSQITDALAAVEAAGLGRRTVEPDEVLITGAPGHEFVQLVGLGLGRPPVAPPPVADLVGAPEPARSHRRRRWGAAVVVATLAVVAVLVVGVGSPQRLPLPPGAIAVLDDSADVLAAATAEVDGATLVVGVLPDGRLRTWDLMTGSIAGPDLDGSALSVATAVVDGSAVAVSRDADQVVHVRRLPDGHAVVPAIGDPEPEHPTLMGSRPRAAAPAELDGRPVVVLAEPADPAALPTDWRFGHRVRALADGAAVGPPVTVPGASLSPFPQVAIVDGAPVVVTTSDEGSDGVLGSEQRTLRVFDMATGAATRAPVPLPAAVTALRVAARGGSPVAVLGCADNTVRLVDLRTGAVGPVLTGHRGRIRQLLVLEDGRRTVVVSEAGAGGSTSSEIRFWDIGTGAVAGPILRDHPAHAGLLTTARAGDRSLLIAAAATGDERSSVAVWDLAALLGGSGS